MKLIFFFYISNLYYIFSEITLNFLEQETNNNLNFNFLRDYFENTSFITNISIGTPNQIISSNIYIENSNFYFDDKEMKNYFIYSKSSSYKQLKNESKYVSDQFTIGILSSDNLNINSNKINNFKFILSVVGNQFKFTKIASIGLKLKNNEYNFLNQLKKNNIINSGIFTIIFNPKNKKNGKIIIGDYLHNFNLNYKNKIFYFDKLSYNDSLFNYYIKFNKIYTANNNNLTNNIDIAFTFDFNGIFCDKKYHKYIYENFFKQLISEKKCFEIFDDNYKTTYYYCHKNLNLKKKFETIYFKSTNLNYIFELNYEDLFLEINNKIYFLIVFAKNIYKNWILGIPFLKKYQFTFNQEDKIIGFYHEKIKLQNGYVIIFLILFIFMIIVFIYQYCKVREREIQRQRYGEKENNQELEYIYQE